jgi:putative Mg2+ transporter-C (MgtC) family protein
VSVPFRGKHRQDWPLGEFWDLTAVFRLNSEEIRGLTTAAGIWLTAAVGVAAGMGLEALAVLSALFGWVVLAMLRLTK